jgi:hypothetical protein
MMFENLLSLIELPKEIVPAANLYLVAVGARRAYRVDIFSSIQAALDKGQENFEDSPLRQKWVAIAESLGLVCIKLTSEPFVVNKDGMQFFKMQAPRVTIAEDKRSELSMFMGDLLEYSYHGKDWGNANIERTTVSYTYPYNNKTHYLYSFTVPNSLYTDDMKTKIDNTLQKYKLYLPEVEVEIDNLN